MLDLLRGSARLKVDLDDPLRPYYPGEAVHGTITIESERDLSVREARISLIYREDYCNCRNYVESHGNSVPGVSKTWSTDKKERQHQVLFSNTIIREGYPSVYEWTLSIPPDAAPTITCGELVQVHWFVCATLDRRLAPDVEAKAGVRVYSRLPAAPTRMGEHGHSNEPDEAEMAFSLPAIGWALGDLLIGDLLVQPWKEFPITEIRIELERCEQILRDDGLVGYQLIPICKISPTNLKLGKKAKFPFRLAMPKSAPVSVVTRNCSIRWFLKGILNRPFRPDTRVAQELFIYNSRPGKHRSLTM